ncbi:hypothetical protein SAMN02910413_1683 [Pseudobutyrivibrio sp. C4]|uniref:hypothetical protein n=1 Tax=Pseudobutyrivibrio sp. C4 TaxID=1520803 RepID=UPI0008BDE0E8|nr:hypothetical protein [Pseudobutyrivibrio sp. C4]SET05889.1 hypothetical protein SAMN02910413_1683 [Pseudobutyrivibrio sp. C4]
MTGYINLDAIMEYCQNQKDKTISCNDLARFPTADVIERSKIDNAKSNIEIMLEQEKQKDGTYTDVGQGIAIALGLLNNELGE